LLFITIAISAAEFICHNTVSTILHLLLLLQVQSTQRQTTYKAVTNHKSQLSAIFSNT